MTRAAKGDPASSTAPVSPDSLVAWVVEQGLRDLPLDRQLAGFCQRLLQGGLPIRRVQLGMDILHPLYGSHAFVWRPQAGITEYRQVDRPTLRDRAYLHSPVHFMRSQGILKLRRRLDSDDSGGFEVFAELRSEGLTDYAASLIPFDPALAEAIADREDRPGEDRPETPVLDGIFFSCATDRPGGFDDRQLDQVLRALPYLGLAVKARLTYDIANTVVETYLGQDAGHRVLAGTIERGSVRAIQAVLWFCDLRGFTRLTDTLPRASLIDMLNSYLEVMARPIQANEGQILKFMGDGLLATFDLTDRDPRTVCDATLDAAGELAREFSMFNRTRRAAGEPVMEFGLALHLGEVLYGNIGARDRLDFTVVGPAVNEASRIQALCRPLGRNILISPTFARSAGRAGRLKSLGLHTLRDVGAPQELFTLRT